MLQNVRVIAFAVSELLRENQLAGKLNPSPPPRSMLKTLAMVARSDEQLNFDRLL